MLDYFVRVWAAFDNFAGIIYGPNDITNLAWFLEGAKDESVLYL
jgi:hypothetical protein